jgi:hypothetical protein
MGFGHAFSVKPYRKWLGLIFDAKDAKDAKNAKADLTSVEPQPAQKAAQERRPPKAPHLGGPRSCAAFPDPLQDPKTNPWMSAEVRRKSGKPKSLSAFDLLCVLCALGVLCVKKLS